MDFRRQYGATAVSVTDGDTIRFVVDLGFRAMIEVPITLRGVDTPELFRKGGDSNGAHEALSATTEWIDQHSFCGIKAGEEQLDFPLLLEVEKVPGAERYRASVTCAQGHDLAEHLIDKGFAKRV